MASLELLKWHRGLAALGECLRHQGTTRDPAQVRDTKLALPCQLPKLVSSYVANNPPAIVACVQLLLELEPDNAGDGPKHYQSFTQRQILELSWPP